MKFRRRQTNKQTSTQASKQEGFDLGYCITVKQKKMMVINIECSKHKWRNRIISLYNLPIANSKCSPSILILYY
jgi:hypothetical protein